MSPLYGSSLCPTAGRAVYCVPLPQGLAPTASLPPTGGSSDDSPRTAATTPPSTHPVPDSASTASSSPIRASVRRAIPVGLRQQPGSALSPLQSSMWDIFSCHKWDIYRCHQHLAERFKGVPDGGGDWNSLPPIRAEYPDDSPAESCASPPRFPRGTFVAACTSLAGPAPPSQRHRPLHRLHRLPDSLLTGLRHARRTPFRTRADATADGSGSSLCMTACNSVRPTA